MEFDKITAAVERCLRHALSLKRPFSHVAEFLAQLRSNPDWTPDEVIEVQTRVIRALMQRVGIEE
jgi:hypothetical protein